MNRRKISGLDRAENSYKHSSKKDKRTKSEDNLRDPQDNLK